MSKIKINGVEIEATAELLKQVQDALAAPKQTAKEWVLDYLSKPFEVKLLKGFITYHRDGQWIFQQDLKNKILWCHYYSFWGIFETEFNMNDKQIQALTKDGVGEALNCKEFTPLNTIYPSAYKVGEALNCKKFTPIN